MDREIEQPEESRDPTDDARRPPTHQHRGRPYRLPVDASAVTDPADGQARAAWLLGLSRLHAFSEPLSSRTVFIERLNDLGIVTDATRLSRWETGHSPISLAVAQAYEKALELPVGSLSLAVESLVPLDESPLAPPRREKLDVALLQSRLDALFAVTLHGRATASDWVDLARLLATRPQIYLPSETWGELTQLLANELARSTPSAFVARFAALRLLVHHPASRHQAIRAIGRIVTNEATHVVVSPLTLLEEVGDDGAVRLLERFLRGPAGYERSGATWAVLSYLRRGQVDAVQLDRYGAITADLLARETGLVPSLDGLALYRGLPPTVQARVLSATSSTASRRVMESARAHGTITEPEHGRRLSARIAFDAQDATPGWRALPLDQMLVRLVNETLFEVDHARRTQATALVAASPYATCVAEAFVKLGNGPDEATAVRALTALTLIPQPHHRDDLLHLALDHRSRTVRVSALMALAQVVGTLSPDDVHRLVARLPGEGMIRSATTYVLGMGGALRGVALTDEIEEVADPGAVEWWAGREIVRA